MKTKAGENCHSRMVSRMKTLVFQGSEIQGLRNKIGMSLNILTYIPCHTH